jgi:hypothetical protein
VHNSGKRVTGVTIPAVFGRFRHISPTFSGIPNTGACRIQEDLQNSGSMDGAPPEIILNCAEVPEL